jgi:hypothetical protein
VNFCDINHPPKLPSRAGGVNEGKFKVVSVEIFII